MTERERFERLVEKTDGCWWWKGTKSFGYGKMTVKRDGKWRRLFAHRVSYELFRGELPPGFHACHHCDNKRCVRPDHLFLGTHQDNIRDYWSKFRKPQASHCRQGHPYDEANSYMLRGRRYCRRCNLLATWRKRGILESKLCQSGVRDVRDIMNAKGCSVEDAIRRVRLGERA